MPKKKAGQTYIDMTPTWSGLLPALIDLAGADKLDARKIAREELAKMARGADYWNQHVKESKKKKAKPRPFFALFVDQGYIRIERLKSGVGEPQWEKIDYDIEGAGPHEICACRKGDIDADHFHEYSEMPGTKTTQITSEVQR